MNETTKYFSIGGMHCLQCQNIIQEKLKSTSGIKEAVVKYSTNIAKVVYDANRISFEKICSIIEKLDYSVLPENKSTFYNIPRTIILVLIIIILSFVLQKTGILNLLVPANLAEKNMSYAMLFVTGILTSVHCVAMCGGIAVSQSLPGNYKNSVFSYNFGRIISYTVIGFLLGTLGAVLDSGMGFVLPTSVQGIFKIIAGIIMVVMGINLLGIIPVLKRFTIQTPQFLQKLLKNELIGKRRPFVIGLLNGLMPCGPLQAMQIVAFSSANPFAGAASMFVFSLGTLPLMLGLGSIVSVLGKKFTRIVMTCGSVLIVVFGIALFLQGYALSGTYVKIEDKVALQNFTEENVQLVKSEITSPRFYPTITVQKGKPVKWIINAPRKNLNGCNYRMYLQDFDIAWQFSEGENVIEFTPQKEGTFMYSCWMGMVWGKIIVK